MASNDVWPTGPENSEDRAKFDAALAEILFVRWYVLPNDLIGGWCISNVNIPPSAQDSKSGHIEIGDFLTEELACYIVALHNMSIETRDLANKERERKLPPAGPLPPVRDWPMYPWEDS